MVDYINARDLVEKSPEEFDLDSLSMISYEVSSEMYKVTIRSLRDVLFEHQTGEIKAGALTAKEGHSDLSDGTIVRESLGSKIYILSSTVDTGSIWIGDSVAAGAQTGVVMDIDKIAGSLTLDLSFPWDVPTLFTIINAPLKIGFFDTHTALAVNKNGLFVGDEAHFEDHIHISTESIFVCETDATFHLTGSFSLVADGNPYYYIQFTDDAVSTFCLKRDFDIVSYPFIHFRIERDIGLMVDKITIGPLVGVDPLLESIIYIRPNETQTVNYYESNIVCDPGFLLISRNTPVSYGQINEGMLLQLGASGGSSSHAYMFNIKTYDIGSSGISTLIIGTSCVASNNGTDSPQEGGPGPYPSTLYHGHTDVGPTNNYISHEADTIYTYAGDGCYFFVGGKEDPANKILHLDAYDSTFHVKLICTQSMEVNSGFRSTSNAIFDEDLSVGVKLTSPTVETSDVLTEELRFHDNPRPVDIYFHRDPAVVNQPNTDISYDVTGKFSIYHHKGVDSGSLELMHGDALYPNDQASINLTDKAISLDTVVGQSGSIKLTSDTVEFASDLLHLKNAIVDMKFENTFRIYRGIDQMFSMEDEFLSMSNILTMGTSLQVLTFEDSNVDIVYSGELEIKRLTESRMTLGLDALLIENFTEATIDIAKVSFANTATVVDYAANLLLTRADVPKLLLGGTRMEVSLATIDFVTDPTGEDIHIQQEGVDFLTIKSTGEMVLGDSTDLTFSGLTPKLSFTDTLTLEREALPKVEIGGLELKLQNLNTISAHNVLNQNMEDCHAVYQSVSAHDFYGHIEPTVEILEYVAESPAHNIFDFTGTSSTISLQASGTEQGQLHLSGTGPVLRSTQTGGLAEFSHIDPDTSLTSIVSADASGIAINAKPPGNTTSSVDLLAGGAISFDSPRCDFDVTTGVYFNSVPLIQALSSEFQANILDTKYLNFSGVLDTDNVIDLIGTSGTINLKKANVKSGEFSISSQDVALSSTYDGGSLILTHDVSAKTSSILLSNSNVLIVSDDSFTLNATSAALNVTTINASTSTMTLDTLNVTTYNGPTQNQFTTIDFTGDSQGDNVIDLLGTTNSIELHKGGSLQGYLNFGASALELIDSSSNGISMSSGDSVWMGGGITDIASTLGNITLTSKADVSLVLDLGESSATNFSFSSTSGVPSIITAQGFRISNTSGTDPITIHDNLSITLDTPDLNFLSPNPTIDFLGANQVTVRATTADIDVLSDGLMLASSDVLSVDAATVMTIIGDSSVAVSSDGPVSITTTTDAFLVDSDSVEMESNDSYLRSDNLTISNKDASIDGLKVSPTGLVTFPNNAHLLANSVDSGQGSFLFTSASSPLTVGPTWLGGIATYKNMDNSFPSNGLITMEAYGVYSVHFHAGAQLTSGGVQRITVNAYKDADLYASSTFIISDINNPAKIDLDFTFRKTAQHSFKLVLINETASTDIDLYGGYLSVIRVG